MLGKWPVSLSWLLVVLFGVNSGGSLSLQQPNVANRSELRENDALSYALVYARKSDNQNALSEIAVRYAKLGDFEQAMRVNESAADEDWRTGAFGEIALEYWRQGRKEEARQLFLRVAGMPLPKDVIYIWGDIIENMAQAEQFDLALETVAAMAAAGGTTADKTLEEIVEEFLKVKSRNRTLPDILPRVVSIARTFDQENDAPGVLKKVAVAYVARGEFNRAIKLIEGFDKDYDRPDGAHQIAIQFARLGQYEQAVRLADEAGNYFRELALVQIASEALKKREVKKAMAIVMRTEALIAKTMKDPDYQAAETDAARLSELAILYSQLSQKNRAVELADLAFKTAKNVGKPGESYGALRSVSNTYSELGLYGKAIEAVAAIDYEQMGFILAAEVGAHAQRKGRLDAVADIVKLIQTTPVKEGEEQRVKALVVIARAGAEQGRTAEAHKLLESIEPLVKRLEHTDNTSEVLKEFAVAFAEAGNIDVALEHVPRIHEPYFITWALIDVGTLSAKRKLVVGDEELRLLNEIVGAELPPEVQPGRLINESGWEIPGLAQARMLRPPELQRTRDRSIQLYFTYYEPEVATFIKRPFPSRRKTKPEEAEWVSEGLKVRLIEERVIKGHKFCYSINC